MELRYFEAKGATEEGLRDAARHCLLTGVERGCVVRDANGSSYYVYASSLLCPVSGLFDGSRRPGLMRRLVDGCVALSEALASHGIHAASLRFDEDVLVHPGGRLCVPALFWGPLRRGAPSAIRADALEKLSRELRGLDAEAAGELGRAAPGAGDVSRACAVPLAWAPPLLLPELREAALSVDPGYVESSHLLRGWLEDHRDPQGRAAAYSASEPLRVVFADSSSTLRSLAESLVECSRPLRSVERRDDLWLYGFEEPDKSWSLLELVASEEDISDVARCLVELLASSVWTARVYVLALSPANVELCGSGLRFVRVGFEGRVSGAGGYATSEECAGVLRCSLAVAMLYLREAWLAASRRAATRLDAAAWERIKSRLELLIRHIGDSLGRITRARVPAWPKLAEAMRFVLLDILGTEEEFTGSGAMAQRIERAARKHQWGGPGSTQLKTLEAPRDEAQEPPKASRRKARRAPEPVKRIATLSRFLTAPERHVPSARDLGGCLETLDLSGVPPRLSLLGCESGSLDALLVAVENERQQRADAKMRGEPRKRRRDDEQGYADSSSS